MSLSITVSVPRLMAPDAQYNIGVTNGLKAAVLTLDRLEDGQGLHVSLDPDDAEQIARALQRAADNVRRGIHGSADDR